METITRTRLRAAEGRKFGITLGLGFAVLGALLWWRDAHRTSQVLLTLGGLALVAGLVIPTRLGPIERVWMKFGMALSRVTTPVFYSALYLLVITPMGFLRRTFSRSPIARDRSQPSYWVRRSPREPDDRRRSLERQF